MLSFMGLPLVLICFVMGIVLVLGGDEDDAEPPPGPDSGQLADINGFGPKIDAIPAYQPQSTCDPTPKPGVVAFRDLVLKVFPGTGDYGISRDCNAKDGNNSVSEHKEGRAWDWKVNVNNPNDVAAVKKLLDWLFATDQYGHKNAMATRLGIMYIIWDNKIWGAYRASDGWRPYNGASEHTDHVHFSFYWSGANKQTTYWNPQQSCQSGSPCPVTSGSTSVIGPPKSVASSRSGKV